MLYNISENKQADTERAAVHDVALYFAGDIIDPVTDLHPRESPVVQNESISKKSARTWPEAGQDCF